MEEREIRTALDQHWAASDANDFETEDRIYHEDGIERPKLISDQVVNREPESADEHCY